MMEETDQPSSRSPSPASSPSHEFSFTVSLEPSFILRQEQSNTPEPLAVDLSPADDIFFHGHLLPLRLLSHLPSFVPPRDSSDGFTLPTGDDHIFDNHRIQVPSPSKSAAIVPSEIRADTGDHGETAARQKHKSKSFSLFGMQRRKITEADEEAEHDKQSKRKTWFDVGQVRQAFNNMVKPFSIFRSRTENDIRYGSSSGRKNKYRHSSGNISITAKNNFKQQVMKRGQYASAPASMRASPTNSGILVADMASPKVTNDSTIEELQAAIQAAILHCKNSIAKEEMKVVN